MHQHQHVHRRRVKPRDPIPDVTTQPNGRVVSVVYVTASPTFTGVIGGPKTVTAGGDDDVVRTTSIRGGLNPSPSQNDNSIVLGDPVFTEGPDETFATDSPDTPSPTPVVYTTQDQNTANPFATTTDNAVVVTATGTSAYISTTMATSRQSSTTKGSNSASATNVASSSGEEGDSSMSTGGKIGLAVGIIFTIGLFAVVALFFLKKKRQQREQAAKAAQEKANYDRNTAAAAAQAAKASTPNAPRLSLRPMSRLAPDLMGGQRSKSRLSQGNALGTVSEAKQPSSGQENPFNDPSNPFADPEKAAAAAAGSPRSMGTPPSTATTAFGMAPHHEAHELEDTRSMSNPTAPGTPQSQNMQTPNTQSPAQMPAPNGAFAAMPPPAPSPAVATGPGAELPQGNVYRILMDFKPTMEDELELISGQLVRLLHEYDDGWALCIRLDRSQQGVVPRTCLAAKPSKPRPNQAPRNNGPGPYRQGPPPGSPMNGPGPRMHGSPIPGPGSPRQGGPRQGPPQSRPMSPATMPRQGLPPSSPPGVYNQAPRPLSPGPRPQPSGTLSPVLSGGPAPLANNASSNTGAADTSRLGPNNTAVRSPSPGVAM